MINAESLGSGAFKKDYALRYAYLAGAMYKGIASKELVVALAEAGMMGFLGSGGMELPQIESNVRSIRAALGTNDRFGVNLLCDIDDPQNEIATAELLVKLEVKHVEAAAFLGITSSLVYWRLTGLKRSVNGRIERPRRLIAKVSRPEVAAAFMQPPPESIVRSLLESGRITAAEAELSRFVPVADDICVEADSGGHTDQGVQYVLLPAMLALRDRYMAEHRYDRPIYVGAAGGIGTPAAAAACFILGADFIVTGSINQCTVEAGTSDSVKDMLQEIDVKDTAYAPAGDMFELGARIQVVKRGVFFPVRANKLYELYTRHASIDEIDEVTRRNIQERYFHRSFDEIWAETRAHYLIKRPEKLHAAERSPKQKMALIFKWYFGHTSRLALDGVDGRKVDYQIHCGPALGAFNQWVTGTELQSWRNRFVSDIGRRLMSATAAFLSERYGLLQCGNLSGRSESERT